MTDRLVINHIIGNRQTIQTKWHSPLKGEQRPAAFAMVFFVFVNFVESVILEAVQSKSLTS